MPLIRIDAIFKLRPVRRGTHPDRRPKAGELSALSKAVAFASCDGGQVRFFKRGWEATCGEACALRVLGRYTLLVRNTGDICVSGYLALCH